MEHLPQFSGWTLKIIFELPLPSCVSLLAKKMGAACLVEFGESDHFLFQQCGGRLFIKMFPPKKEVGVNLGFCVFKLLKKMCDDVGWDLFCWKMYQNLIQQPSHIGFIYINSLGRRTPPTMTRMIGRWTQNLTAQIVDELKALEFKWSTQHTTLRTPPPKDFMPSMYIYIYTYIYWKLI